MAPNAALTDLMPHWNSCMGRKMKAHGGISLVALSAFVLILRWKSMCIKYLDDTYLNGDRTACMCLVAANVTAVCYMLLTYACRVYLGSTLYALLIDCYMSLHA